MTRAVEIDLVGTVLRGDLNVPVGAPGLVIFAHGSGSSRRSPRNRFVAGVINRAGLGTLLMDLLSEEEERVDEMTRELRFDIDLLGRRVAQVVEWAGQRQQVRELPVGLFGSSTGAAAALVAAASMPEEVHAIVSRGGRPDLAGDSLPDVKCPTLLVVGGLDDVVIGLNEQARSRMNCPTRLVIVPGATHLFEEPGTLEQVANLAAEWFAQHLASVEKTSRVR